MRISRRLKITALTLVGAVAIAAAWMWHSASQPLYKPGMIHTPGSLNAPLEPPKQSIDSNRWLVEPGIELHHWSVGNGLPILVLHGGPGFPFESMPEGFAALQDRYEVHCYDQRGCGRSTRPFDRFESGNFYGNMLKLEKTLGIGAANRRYRTHPTHSEARPTYSRRPLFWRFFGCHVRSRVS